MATYDKPTTSIYVNYGDLDPLATQSSLAPVLIAPRYALHRMSGGTTALLGEYTDLAGSTASAFPDKADNSVVDLSSVVVKVDNPEINVGSASADTVEGSNKLTFAGDVTLAGGTSVFGNFDVAVGDKVRIASSLMATVTSIAFTAGTASATATAVRGGTLTVSDEGSSFTGTEYTQYLVEVGASANTITNLVGNPGYEDSITGNTFAGVQGMDLIISGATAGDSFIVDAVPAGAEKTYNIVYVDKAATSSDSATNIELVKTNLIDVATLPGSAIEVSENGVKINQTEISFGDNSYALEGGVVYSEYRELLLDDTLTLRTNLSSGARAWAGDVDPANPMGMMFAAASGAVENPFFYMLSTDGSDDAATIKAIDYVAQFEPVYALVPYLNTEAVHSAVVATIDKYAAPTIAQFKHAWLAPVTKLEKLVIDSNTAGTSLVGALSSGTLTVLNADEGQINSKIIPGDIVNIKLGYNTDSGAYTELKGTVLTVSDNVVTLSGVGSANGTFSISFSRKYSAGGYAKALADEAKALNNYHINLVGADKVNFVTAGFEDVDKAYLCSALATTRGAIPPHAPMNSMAVPGFAVEDTLKWTDTDYTEMNNGGVWIVYSDVDDNTVTYHQITTKTDGTIAEDDSVVSNSEAIVRQCRLAVKPLTGGQGNATDQLLNAVRTRLITVLTSIQGEYYPELYGPRIINWEIARLYIPEGNRRSVRCVLDIDTPEPTQDSRFDFNLF